ncbi:Predicted dehydrogenase [Paenibacillus sp. UNC496MF]|uniref:Gfo/Idh/MocA family protein n=1 Tax=Paenibacillus sp. UNC496MF TaxID=1502753 RepID=UPI0008E51400|nr:Gfo/Idh/MocA family oxidoreductase [Paenibacillus sp. UNC496MF]SFJ82617.1 Predicted dehydrogenase [Paenibacillus sp. UNC496MF]
MKETLNFAIAGYGMIAAVHAKCLGEMKEARLAAVFGNHPQKTAAFAAEYGAKAYADYRRMLERVDLDAVCILTPSGTHAELGVLAAEAGKHVVVEKPIDVSLDSADRLIEACRRNGVKLCVVSQHRFDSAASELKRAIDAGRLGQLNFGTSQTKWYRSQDYYDATPWRGTWAMDGGGALMNQSIHYVDLLRCLMGSVVEVFAYTATRAHVRIEAEDMAVAAVKFKSGAIGMIEGSTSAYPGFFTRLDIHGTEGTVMIENDEIKAWELQDGGVYAPPAGPTAIVGATGSAISHHSHRRLLEDFVEAIREDREPLVNGEEGRRTLEVVLAAYESARTGKPIRIGTPAAN